MTVSDNPDDKRTAGAHALMALRMRKQRRERSRKSEYA